MAVKRLAAETITTGLTEGADVTISHFRIVSDTGTAKTQWLALGTARTLPAGGKLSIGTADLMLTKTGSMLGASAAAYNSNEAFLDGEFENGDKIEWGTAAGTKTTRLPETSLTWSAATAS